MENQKIYLYITFSRKIERYEKSKNIVLTDWDILFIILLYTTEIQHKYNRMFYREEDKWSLYL